MRSFIPHMAFRYHGPLAPDSPLFRGRTDELTQLIGMCRSEVIAYPIIFGGRQNGKTSLLLRLAAAISPPARVCIADFQHVPGVDMADACHHIARRVARSLALPEPPPDRTIRLADFLEQVLVRPEVGRLVLILEELGALPRDTRLQLANVLRAIFHDRYAVPALAKVIIVLAGGSELYNLAATEVSPLCNICAEMYLGDLAEADAVALIADVLVTQGVSSALSEVIGNTVYARASGHPYLTQRLGGLLENVLRGGKTLSPAAVEQALEQVLSADVLLDHLHRGIEVGDLQPSVRDLLANRVRFSRLESEMARLELLGVAKGDGGYWRVRNPLLERALQAWLQPRNDDPLEAEQSTKLHRSQLILDQQRLLKAHRATLTTLLVQQARLGTAYAPPGVEASILEAREGIQQCKAALLRWDVSVEDLPDDELPKPSDDL